MPPPPPPVSPPSAKALTRSAAPLAELSPRERDVLARSWQEVFPMLTSPATAHLSEGTVRNYVSAILSKLRVADRPQAF